ncbi:DMT family transporter [Psychromonas sp. SR45-3]|uniref:EamA family transporter n=1 Tax=Psychromonas sp. SR45-3 TaxID=2760930 RepID=UPI0015FC22F1|nr:EamA family transporter [Psychromonas sp. SR45-3]MBB1273613.1 EamA family transporter [Psychromonas sp. SR45-3]
MRSLINQNQTLFAVVAIIVAMLSITVGASLAKSIFSFIKPESVTFMRLSMAAVMLFFVCRVWEVKITGQNIGSVFVYGLTIAGMNLFFYLAIKTIPIGVALAVELIGPLLVAILFSKHKSDFVWAILAAIGIYLLIPNASSNVVLDSRGLVYAAIAGFFWGSYIIVGKKAGFQHGVKAPALGLIVASMALLPVAVNTFSLSDMSIEIMGLLIAIALLSSLIPLVLEMQALRHLPTKTYGVLTSGEPVLGALAGFFILNEQLVITQSIGISIIVFASIASVLSPSVMTTKNVALKINDNSAVEVKPVAESLK